MDVQPTIIQTTYNFLAANKDGITSLGTITAILASIVSLVFVATQLRRSSTYFEHGNKIKKAELITILNDKITPFRPVRSIIRECKTKDDVSAFLTRHADHPSYKEIKDFHHLALWARDYAVLFESLWPFIKSRAITNEEFDRYFGKRFSEFYESDLMKVFLDLSEFSDMKENLSNLENTRRELSQERTKAERK